MAIPEHARKLIATRAAKLANKQVREELLADDGEYSLVRRLALTSGTTVSVLRSSWKPLKPDWSRGFGYRLKLTDDRLTIELLKDTGLYDRVVEIGISAMSTAMVNNAKVFVEGVLDDLFEVEA